MSDHGDNGAVPLTLEQRVHALEAEREADRRHIGHLEDRWGQLLTASIQTQASARKAATAANNAHGVSASLELRFDTFEKRIEKRVDVVVDKLEELIAAVRAFVGH